MFLVIVGIVIILTILIIATLGSILDSQLSRESCRIQLARWSHNVSLFSWNHPTAAHPFLELLDILGSWYLANNLFYKVKIIKGVCNICTGNICQANICHGFETELFGKPKFHVDAIFPMKIGSRNLFGRKYLVWNRDEQIFFQDRIQIRIYSFMKFISEYEYEYIRIA